MLNISLGKDVRVIDLVVPFLSNVTLLQLVQTEKLNVKYRRIVVKRKYEHQKTIDFQYKKIKCVSAELGQLQALRELDLSHNQLACVPADAFGVGQLQALRELNFSHNQLTCGPAELGQLQALRRLDLNNNQLVYVPADAFGVGQLQALRELDLSYNQLACVPADAFGVGQLQELDLRHFELDQ